MNTKTRQKLPLRGEKLNIFLLKHKKLHLCKWWRVIFIQMRMELEGIINWWVSTLILQGKIFIDQDGSDFQSEKSLGSEGILLLRNLFEEKKRFSLRSKNTLKPSTTKEGFYSVLIKLLSSSMEKNLRQTLVLKIKKLLMRSALS